MQGAEKRSFSLESLIQKVVLRWVYNFREEEGQDLVSLAEDEQHKACLKEEGKTPETMELFRMERTLGPFQKFL